VDGKLHDLLQVYEDPAGGADYGTTAIAGFVGGREPCSNDMRRAGLSQQGSVLCLAKSSGNME